MEECGHVSFAGLFEALEDKIGQHVFSDEYFQRRIIETQSDPDIALNVIIDSLKDANIKCYHISIVIPDDKTLEIEFEQADHVLHDQGRLISSPKKEKLYWIPQDPFIRNYDSHGRIGGQERSAFETKTDANGFSLSVKGSGENRIEFCVLTFSNNIESFTNEICELSPLETRKVVKAKWFYYEGLKDTWKYFINAKIFDTGNTKASVRNVIQCQNITYALYYYLDYLYNQTHKQIYMYLCDLIAYSLLLSFPEDYRLRHGSWTDLMETHTVYQVSSINVLISCYERSGCEIFLQKAIGAMDYLISLAEELDQGDIWFLHDTLELNIEDVRLFYKQLTPSKAFGKSVSNTLCINTHIWTMIALLRLNQLEPSDKRSRVYDKAMSSLKKVLQAKPCTALYYIIYKLWDVVVKLNLKYNNRLTRKMLKVYNILLNRHILPFLKKTFPRLAMPNGFLERDLSYSTVSLNYHFVNLRNMLMLYGRTKDQWLKWLITKSIDYSVNSSIVEYFGVHNPNAWAHLDNLFLYSSLIDQRYLSRLLEYMSIFRENNLPLTMDFLSNPYIANYSLEISVDDTEVVVLTPACDEQFVAVLLNPGPEDKKVNIKSTLSDRPEEFEMVDSDDSRSPWKDQVIVPGAGYVMIVKKSLANRDVQ